MKKMRLFTAIVALVGVWALGGCGVSSPEPAVATRDTEITAKDSQYHSESTKAEKEAELRHAGGNRGDSHLAFGESRAEEQITYIPKRGLEVV